MIAADKFQIHYYLANESHSMDAFVRNKCEAELLALFQEVCAALGVPITIETLPFAEGGLIEFWKVYGENHVQINTTLALLTVVISGVTTALSRIPVSDAEKDAREKTIQELTIEEKKLAVEEKRITLERLKKEMQEGEPLPETFDNAVKAVEQNIKVQSRRSNFYKELSQYEKVTSVGFSALDVKNNAVMQERIVSRSDFSRYVLVTNDLPVEPVDGAVIEIIAPVLKAGNYKWKGIYCGEPISFYMTDAEFKNSVIQEKVSFQNGSCITCVLQISRKVNEIGDVEITGYSVTTVLEKTDGNLSVETPQGKKYRAYKKFVESQQDLFG